MFERVISLGWFCSVAMETKRLGMRDASYPFDWLLTHNFSKVLKILEGESDTDMLLNNDEMLQYEGDASRWYNKRYQISLFHDFDKYKKMIYQLDSVNDKYKRRVHRLHKCVGATLFIRYVKDKDEAEYIRQNEAHIAKIIKLRNPDNEILYIAHPDFKQILCNLRSRVYFVANDENDYVSREFLKALPELERYLLENVTCHPIFEVDKSKKISGGGRDRNKIISWFRKQAVNDNPIHQNGMLESTDDE